MSRPISIQVYVNPELAARVRSAAASSDLTVSEWLRSLIRQYFDSELSASSERDLLGKLYKQSLFAFVGIDALLSGHPDHLLRGRVHEAYTARCKQADLAAAFDEGANDEA